MGSNPAGVAVNPRTDTIYVANSGSNNVSVINGTTNVVTATIRVGDYPISVAVDRKTNVIYAANLNSNTVSVIKG